MLTGAGSEGQLSLALLQEERDERARGEERRGEESGGEGKGEEGSLLSHQFHILNDIYCLFHCLAFSTSLCSTHLVYIALTVLV